MKLIFTVWKRRPGPVTYRANTLLLLLLGYPQTEFRSRRPRPRAPMAIEAGMFVPLKASRWLRCRYSIQPRCHFAALLTLQNTLPMPHYTRIWCIANVLINFTGVATWKKLFWCKNWISETGLSFNNLFPAEAVAFESLSFHHFRAPGSNLSRFFPQEISLKNVCMYIYCTHSACSTYI